jgi:hypothetical protein
MLSVKAMAVAGSSGSVLRGSVLNLYRKILRARKTWESAVPSETASDKNYILEETRRLFKQNKSLTEPKEIQECIKEGEARLELGT